MRAARPPHGVGAPDSLESPPEVHEPEQPFTGALLPVALLSPCRRGRGVGWCGRGTDGGGDARFAFPTGVSGERLHWSPFLDRVGVRRADEFEDPDGEKVIVASRARLLRATYVIHHPISPGRTLLLAERRSPRVFHDEDWAVLQGLIQQTRATVEPIRLSAEMRPRPEGSTSHLDPTASR